MFLKRTRLACISSLWKNHSEHIKHLVALGTTDRKMLEHARSYIHALDLKSSVEEFDDVIELTFLLTKVEYPKHTQVPIILQQQVLRFSKGLTPFHINHIGGFIQLLPECLISFLDIFFSVTEFIDKFQQVLKTMDFEDIISFSSAVAKNNGVALCASRNIDFLLLVASGINDGIDRMSPNEALKLLQKCDFPLWKYVKKLSLKIDRLDRTLSSDEVLSLFFLLERNRRNHREFAVVYQQLLCRRLKSFQFSQIVRVLETVLLFDIPVRERLWTEVIGHVSSEESGVADLEKLCACVKTQEFKTDPTSLLFLPKLVRKLNKRLLPHVKECTRLDENNVKYLLCYGYISCDSATKLFRKIKSKDIDPSTKTLIYLCKFMHCTNDYRKDVILQLATESKKLTQEECIFLLNGVFHSGLDIEEKLLEEAVGSFAYRQFSSRTGQRSSSLNDTTLFLLLKVLCHIDSTKYDQKLFPFSRLLQSSRISKSERLVLLSASIEYNKNPALSKVFLFDILSRANECNQKELQIIFLALAALRVREALIFTKLLKLAKKMEVSIPLIISIAKSAHSLKLVVQFSRSNIVESIKSLSGVSFQTLIELLKYCTITQRQHIISLSDKGDFAKKADLGNMSTSSLLILSNTSLIHRNDFMEILKTRAPCESGDLTSEEVILCLEKSINESEVKLILRICGLCLHGLDERQLVRMFKCLSKLEQCPNIAFRILGRSIMRNIKSMTPDEALLWLNLYVKYEIRDDAVAKVLLRKAQTRKSWGSKELETQVKEAEYFYGVSHARTGAKKEHSTAFFPTTL